MIRVTRSILVVLIVLLSTNVMSQEGNLYIFGSLIDYHSVEKLLGVTVSAVSGGETVKSDITEADGKFELFLPLQKEYRIAFSKDGYVSKFVDVDSRNIPEEKVAGGFSMQLDMKLFKEQPGFDFSVFDQPMAKSKYSSETGSIDWDQQYSADFSKKVDAAFSGLVNKHSEEVKIRKLLNDWHAAAATADEEIYFESLTDDAIYLGTDKTERWTKRDFEVWAEPHFKTDEAWVFKSYDRFINFSDDMRFAWFDELLETNMGTCRGSGVVVKTNAGWRIKQYNLALTIDNEDMDKVKAACAGE